MNSTYCGLPAKSAIRATGTAMGHAGEYLQGVIEEDGVRHSVLVSVPTPELGSRSHYEPAWDVGLEVHPSWKQKSLRAFELAWRSLSDLPSAGFLRMESDLPVSRGMGSSTADCVAAIRAAARCLNRTLSNHQIAHFVHLAELSSDATMYGSRPVVFRHREGRVHRTLHGTAPPFDLMIVESAQGAFGVDTDAIVRPHYTGAEVAEFNELLERFSLASECSDLAEICYVAERSADINQRYHPLSGLTETRGIARGFGACGTAIAHSGDIRVLLFTPQTLSSDLQIELARDLARADMAVWRVLSDRQHAIEQITRRSAEDAVTNCPAGGEKA